MSKNSILVIDESDSKLDQIIELLSNNDSIIKQLSNNHNQLINQYKDQVKQLEEKLAKLELELEQKNSKIERLERIKSDFKINTDSNIDNRLKQNLLIRQKKPFPFNHFLSYDYAFNKY
jgi:TolA-binding protein